MRTLVLAPVRVVVRTLAGLRVLVRGLAGDGAAEEEVEHRLDPAITAA